MSVGRHRRLVSARQALAGLRLRAADVRIATRRAAWYGDCITAARAAGLIGKWYRRTWRTVGADGRSREHSRDVLKIMDPEQPAGTITASEPKLQIHWRADRFLTPDEARRLCSFPEEFEMLKLSYDQRWERYGRAVPPLLMFAIAAQIRNVLLGKDKRRWRGSMAIGARYEPYTMADVAKVPKNGLSVISTFSGCGGSSLGYKMAGFDVRAALEFDKEAADTYEANFPNTPVLREDIRKVTGADLLKLAKLKPGQLDVLDGSPPCASFSTAGKRQKGWGQVREYSGQKQRTDDLFEEYGRLLSELKPRAFVAENVSGMKKGVAKGYFNTMLTFLASKGYQVGCRLLDASLLGVPQRRERVFFIGFRNDLGLTPVYPRPLGANPVTLREALHGVKNAGPPEELGYGQHMAPSMLALLQQMAPGESGAKYHPKGSWFSLERLEWDRPVNTVQASHGVAGGCACIYPDADRRLTIPELRRVCSFPEDFQLTGPFKERWERLGRSVPPFMMRAIGTAIGSTLRAGA